MTAPVSMLLALSCLAVLVTPVAVAQVTTAAAVTEIAATTGDVDVGACFEVFVGDGFCDDSQNSMACDWDGGDCCASSGEFQQFHFCQLCKCKDPTFVSTTTTKHQDLPFWKKDADRPFTEEPVFYTTVTPAPLRVTRAEDAPGRDAQPAPLGFTRSPAPERQSTSPTPSRPQTNNFTSPAREPPEIETPTNFSVIQFTVSSGVGLYLQESGTTERAVPFVDQSGTSDVVADFATVQQRGSGAISASVGGKYLVTETTSLQTAKVTRSQLDIVVQTGTIYYDSDYVVVYIAGSPPNFGAVSSETVSLVFTLGSNSKTVSCGKLSTAKGSVCSKSLSSSSWFTSEDQAMEVYATIASTGARSASRFITLRALPDLSPTSTVAWLHTPSYAMLGGASFTATLYANTTNARGKDDSLSTWSIEIPHNTSLLYVDDSVDSDLYDIVVNDADGVLSAVATYKTAYASSPELLTGAIELGSFSFEVASGVETGSISPSFAVDIVSMVSLNSFEFYSDGIGAVLDGAGFTEAGDASVVVVDKSRVGIDAYVAATAEQELINTRVLGNPDESAVSIKVVKITSCHTAGGKSCQEGSSTVATMSSGFTCAMNSSAMDLVAQISDGGVLSFDGTESSGGDIYVAVSDGTFVDYVPFRVWYPDSVTIHVDDPILNRVDGGCGDWTFQRTQLSAVATFGGPILVGELGPVDVTSNIEFCTPNSTQEVKLNGTTLIGLTEGDIVVHLCTDKNAFATASQTIVSVSSSEVSAQTIDSTAVLSGVVFDSVGFNASSEFETAVEFEVTAHGELHLSAEEDSAWVFPSVRFSDGSLQFIDAIANVSSLQTSVIAVNTSAQPVQIYVPFGASSGDGSDILTVSWSPCSTSPIVLMSTNPWVTVALPAATSVAVSVDTDVIYHSSDPLVNLGMDTAAVLSVLLGYEDGSERDMEEDPRTVFTPSSNAITMSDNVAEASFVTSTVVAVNVSFGNYAALTDSVDITIAKMVSLSLTSDAYPSCSASECSGKVDIFPIVSTNVSFQRLEVSATALDSSSNSFSIDLDEDAEVVFNDTDVVAGVATGACNSGSGGSCTVSDGSFSSGIVEGVGEGGARIEVFWFNFSAAVDLEVHETAVSVVDIAIASPTDDYIETEIDTDTVMKFTTTFSDGTSFTNVKSDESTNPSSWIPIDSYLSFASSDSSRLAIGSTGTLTLWNNTLGDSQVSITVSSAADSSVSTVGNFYTNIKPSCYDVDIGMTASQTLPGYEVGDTFSVPVRINTCNKALTGFQVQIYFDPNVVTAVKDGETDGSNWPGTITYTYGSPSSMVQVLSSEPSSTAKGSKLLLTTLEFEVVGSGGTWFTGVVVDTLTSGGSSLGDTNRQMIAGQSYFETSTSRRARLLLEQELAVRSIASHIDTFHTIPRQLSTDWVKGDTNGDSLFTVSDLDTIKRFYVGSDIDYVDEAAQLAEMDADMDGTVDTLDIVFINAALAKKFRFLLNETQDVISVSHSGCTMDISATVTLDTGDFVSDGDTTKVFFVLGDVDDTMVVDGTSGFVADTSSDGVVVQAGDPQNGVFSASFDFVQTVHSVSIVVVIKTYEDNGDTDEQRLFSYYGTSYAGEDFSFEPLMTYSGISGDCLISSTSQAPTSTPEQMSSKFASTEAPVSTVASVASSAEVSSATEASIAPTTSTLVASQTSGTPPASVTPATPSSATSQPTTGATSNGQTSAPLVATGTETSSTGSTTTGATSTSAVFSTATSSTATSSTATSSTATSSSTTGTSSSTSTLMSTSSSSEAAVLTTTTTLPALSTGTTTTTTDPNDPSNSAGNNPLGGDDDEDTLLLIIIIVVVILVIVIIIVVIVLVKNKKKRSRKNRILPQNVPTGDNDLAKSKKPDLGPGVTLEQEELKEFNRLLALPMGDELLKAIKAANALNAPIVAGADVDLLMNAVTENDVAEVKRQLLSGCCSLPATHPFMHKLFLTAARKGQFEMVQMLWAAGADINQTDRVGNTALHYVSMAEKEDIIKFLLEKGAEISENHRGEPPRIPQSIFVGGAFPEAEEALRLLNAGGHSAFSVKKDAQGYCVMEGTCAISGLQKSDLDQFNIVAQQALIGVAAGAGYNESDTMSSVKKIEFAGDDGPYVMQWRMRYEDSSAKKNALIEKLVQEVRLVFYP